MKAPRAYFLLTTSVILTACVPAKKYEELLSKHEQCEKDLQTYKDKAEGCEKNLKEVRSEFEQLQEEVVILRRDNMLKEDSYANLTTRYDKLNDVNLSLMSQLEKLQSMAKDESANLSAELQRKQLELQSKQDELRRLEADLKTLRNDLEVREKILAEKQARVDELENLLKQKEEVVNALNNKLASALLGFKDKGLTVEQKNGKVYVKMEAKLLFATGSTKVSGEGKKALIELAKALEDEKDMEVMVEGHTDTDRLKSNNYPHNNWELSVLRATSVVQIMTENSSIDPKILSASGRSEYHPVSEDKSRNRRIEVILTPNLDALYALLNP